MLVFLDTKLLWLIVHPGGGADANGLRNILVRRQEDTGDQVGIAEICDYEARRELIRKNATRQISNVDHFIQTNIYVPLDTDTMRDAAVIWANLRRQGRPTAADSALDGDVILGAQAIRQGLHLVATDNLKHLGQICNAIDWRNL
jgi:predicted nucleic acid-binding protein